MPLLMDGWPSKPRLSAICTMIFHYTAALLFLSCPCRGQSQMVGPSQPIVATVGEDIVLPCHLEPAVNVTDMTVEWTRPDLNPRFVYVWRDGVELEMKKHQSYVGRTSVSITKLRHGDISLKLCKVKLSDKGKFRCFIPTLSRESTVELVVGAVSSLTVSFMRTDSDEDLRGAVLQCESAGWYPEPEVLWLDGEGNLLSAGPTVTVRGPDDLYTVSSRVTVEKRHSNSFTCRVQQNNINQTRETHIQVPDDFFNAACSSAAPITISLAVVFIVILAVVFVVWKWRQKQNSNNAMRKETKATSSNNTELQSLNEEKKETLPDMAESTTVKDLDQEKAELDVKLKEVEEDCKDVEGLRGFLVDQKKKLDDQMHDLGLQLHDIEMQRDEIMSGVEKIKQKEDNNKNDSKEKRDEKQCLDKNTNLDTAKEELEKRKQETDIFLRSIFCGVIMVTERRTKLDNLREQIKKQLKEIEEQRGEIQIIFESNHYET